MGREVVGRAAGEPSSLSESLRRSARGAILFPVLQVMITCTKRVGASLGRCARHGQRAGIARWRRGRRKATAIHAGVRPDSSDEALVCAAHRSRLFVGAPIFAPSKQRELVTAPLLEKDVTVFDRPTRWIQPPARMAAPRSTMDRDGVMRWRCSQCSVYRLETDIVWGIGGGREEWPPWRVVCMRCSAALPKLSTPPAVKHSPQRSQLSPRRTVSPRRLVPLATARADLTARSACTRAAASGGSLAAASILRPPAPRRFRDPQRHALVSRFRDDGLHARPKPLAAPGVNSRLQALSTIQHSIRCRSDADEDEDEPPPGGYHPQIFFEPKLERSMLRGLLAQTTMSRSELYRLFNRFKALCQVRCRAANPPPPRPLPPVLLSVPLPLPLLPCSPRRPSPDFRLPHLHPFTLAPPPAPCTLPSRPGGGAAAERDTRLN
jgi:hypothetical protein